MIPARFASTRWSVVAAVGTSEASAARTAMAWLCTTYWDPLRAHVIRCGFQAADADDLTQDFLLRVVQGGVIERADRERGRFRTFLLACLDHHLAHARERCAAQKRGGGVRHVATEPIAPADDPAAGFDREWAEVLLSRARIRLITEAGDQARIQSLMPFLASNGDAAAYAAVGAQLGLESGAVRVAVHRLRQRFATALRAEISETLAEPTEAAIDAEIADLLAALAANSQ
jgi:DNA-directed RNA polymerase specialized sigma24 family protein